MVSFIVVAAAIRSMRPSWVSTAARSGWENVGDTGAPSIAITSSPTLSNVFATSPGILEITCRPSSVAPIPTPKLSAVLSRESVTKIGVYVGVLTSTPSSSETSGSADVGVSDIAKLEVGRRERRVGGKQSRY